MAISHDNIIWKDQDRTIPANFNFNIVVDAARQTNGAFISYKKSDDSYHYYNVRFDSMHALGEFSERLGIHLGMHIMIQSYEHRKAS